jgi:glycine cleavage system regulatory protein
MNVSLVITVVGPDRPGIVSLLSERGQAFGANWAESRMASVAGQFAGIVHLQVAAESAERLIVALQELESRDLRIVIVRVDGAPIVAEPRLHRLEVVGQDRRGIIHDLSRCLSDCGVSIVELHTEFTSGAWSAENLFKVTALLSMPASLSVAELRNRLETLGNDLMVDLEVDQKVAITGSQNQLKTESGSHRRET